MYNNTYKSYNLYKRAEIYNYVLSKNMKKFSPNGDNTILTISIISII